MLPKDFQPAITSNPELAGKMEAIRLPHVLVTNEELELMGTSFSDQEIEAMKTEAAAWENIPKLPDFQPVITSSPKMAEMFEATGIPYELVTEAELNKPKKR